MRDLDLMRSCVFAAKRHLGSHASEDEIVFTTLLIFGFEAGLWSSISSTQH